MSPLAMTAAMALLCACSSCELLRASLFCVESWTPGEGRFDGGGGVAISVTFSEPPDRVSVENAFSMTEDGTDVSGAFIWYGSTLVFAPYAAIGVCASFRVRVSGEAMDARGVSLDPPLEGRFTTRAEDGRPAVLSTVPARGATTPGRFDSVTITFTEPVDPSTYRDRLSVSPYASGAWSLDDAGSVALFAPLEPWTWGGEYCVTVSSGLRDASGNESGDSYAFRFSVGDDRSAPSLLEAVAVDASGDVRANLSDDSATDGTVTENEGWEGPWRLRFRFSEPVALRSLDSRIVCDEGLGMELETGGRTAETVTYRIVDRPAWGRRFSVRMKAGIEDERGNATESELVFRLVANGPGSEPPRFVGLRLPLAPGAALADDRDLVAFGVDEPFSTVAISGDADRYPVAVATATAMELYIKLAPGASLDALSVMETFGVTSTNGAMTFSANRVGLSGFAYASPYAGWDSYAVARVDGTITNRVDSGIVTFGFAAGLRDSAGNVAAEAQRLPLLK